MSYKTVLSALRFVRFRSSPKVYSLAISAAERGSARPAARARTSEATFDRGETKGRCGASHRFN